MNLLRWKGNAKWKKVAYCLGWPLALFSCLWRDQMKLCASETLAGLGGRQMGWISDDDDSKQLCLY